MSIVPGGQLMVDSAEADRGNSPASAQASNSLTILLGIMLRLLICPMLETVR
jgi:hypothetical protein